MRLKTVEEKEFNDAAAAYGIKAFTAQEFDKDEELQVAFDSYWRSRDFVLEDDLSNILEEDMGYIYFLESHKDSYGESTVAFEVASTQGLFELVVPIKEISCRLYQEIYTQGLVSIQIHGKLIEDTSIYDKVKKWHKFRREIDRIKPFVEKRYLRWENADKNEKKEILDDLNKLIEDLDVLGVDTRILSSTHKFLKNYPGLNSIKKLKIATLLGLKLPLINSEKIAKKIIENSIA